MNIRRLDTPALYHLVLQGNDDAVREIALRYQNSELMAENLVDLHTQCELEASKADGFCNTYALVLLSIIHRSARVQVYHLERAQRLGNTLAMCHSAQIMIKSQSYGAATVTLDQAIDLGSIYARNLRAQMIRNGWGFEKDYEEAIKCFEDAIECGSSHDAMNNLALLLEDGQGCTADPVRAVALYQEAIRRGSREAMYNYALRLLRPGEEQDKVRAAALLREAGCQDALMELQKLADISNTPRISYQNCMAHCWATEAYRVTALDKLYDKYPQEIADWISADELLSDEQRQSLMDEIGEVYFSRAVRDFRDAQGDNYLSLLAKVPVKASKYLDALRSAADFLFHSAVGGDFTLPDTLTALMNVEAIERDILMKMQEALARRRVILAMNDEGMAEESEPNALTQILQQLDVLLNAPNPLQCPKIQSLKSGLTSTDLIPLHLYVVHLEKMERYADALRIPMMNIKLPLLTYGEAIKANPWLDTFSQFWGVSHHLQGVIKALKKCNLSKAPALEVLTVAAIVTKHLEASGSVKAKAWLNELPRFHNTVPTLENNVNDNTAPSYQAGDKRRFRA